MLILWCLHVTYILSLATDYNLVTFILTIDWSIQLKTGNEEEVYAGMLKGCKSKNSQTISTDKHGLSFTTDEVPCEKGTEMTCAELFIPTKSV